MRQAKLLAVFSLACLAGAVLNAQTTFATITGAVTDPSGLAIPGAHVTATQAESGYKYEAQTNESGVYTLPNLLAGKYKVNVTAGGFKDSEVNNVELVSRDVRRLDVSMQIGQVSTTVEVTGGGATLVETETARISQTRTANDMEKLPLNTRSLTAFLSLAPGVGSASDVTSTRRYAGSRRNESDISVDGVSTTASNGTQISPLTNYIESFSEARVDMANNTAENAPIGEVTVVSKSGTNELHGSAFDYYVTPMFRARDPFAPERASGISHRPGGSIGGPVVIPHLYNGHNKTFFYASYETSQGSITQQLLNPGVPLAAWRTGDFSALLPSTVIKDPTNGKPFTNNMIPKDRLNATALAIQDMFYPLPNFGNNSVFQTANYRQIVTHPFDPNNYWTTRVDHRFSEKQFVYGRYTWQRQNNTDFDTNGNLPAIGRIYDQRNTRQMLISWTDMFTTQLVNEMRYGYAFTNEPRWGPLNGPDTVNKLGLQGLLPDLPNIPGIPNIIFSGLGIQTISQQVCRDPGFYNRAHFLQDHLDWFHGKHSIKSGVQLTRYDANDVSQSSNLFGNVTFSNRFTGFPYADFLLGLPTTLKRAGPALDSPFYRYAYDFFVTDEYKITPKLTLNLGVRYELHPYWSSGNDLSSVFDIKTGAIVVPDGSVDKVNKLLPANYVKVIPASQAGYSGTALLTTDKNNFAPRVGLAWRPFGEKTVIRAGFGIYYDVVPAYVNMAGVPFSISEPSYTNPTTNPTVLPVVFPNSVAGPTTVSLPSAFKKDLRIPYSIQYNITIERQIGKMGVRLSYIATGTRQGEYAYNYNSPIADANLYINKLRPFPQFPNFNYVTNGAGHQYNSLNFEVKRRFASGLLYDFSWVWARDIGDLEGGNVPTNTLEYQAPEYAYDLHRERAVWEDIPTHRVTGDFIYEMPFGKGKKWLSNGHLSNLIFGGWELSAAYAFNTGMFLTPLWTGPDPTGTFNTSNSTPAQVTIRPNATGDPNTGPQTVNDWFNVGAFTPPAKGMFGTSAKGVIIGPSSWVIDSQVAKNFAITERLRLRAELGATNLLNHPNWGNPGLNISSLGSAGVITSVGYGNGTTGGVGLDASGQRSLRLGVRVEW